MRKSTVHEEGNFTWKIFFLCNPSNNVCNHHEMIIMNPNNWSFFSVRFFQDSSKGLQSFFRKCMIEPHVSFPMLLTEDGSVGHRMEQRPDGRLTPAGICSVSITLVNVNRNDCLICDLSRGGLISRVSQRNQLTLYIIEN